MLSNIFVEQMNVEQALHLCFSSDVQSQIRVLESHGDSVFSGTLTFSITVPISIAKEALNSYKGKVRVSINNA